MLDGIRLNYSELREISPKAGRKAILQVLKSTNGNICETAKLLHTTRRTIYKALKKEKSGDLDDYPRASKTIHNHQKYFKEKQKELKTERT